MLGFMKGLDSSVTERMQSICYNVGFERRILNFIAFPLPTPFSFSAPFKISTTAVILLFSLSIEDEREPVLSRERATRSLILNSADV